MKKGWIIFITIVVIIIAVVAIAGGKMYMDNKKVNEDMNEVVQSKEAKDLFEKTLKKMDSEALTEEGRIKSYKIDSDSVKHNPMGGINVTLIVNNNKNLHVNFTIDKGDKGIRNSGISYSEKLEKLTEEN